MQCVSEISAESAESAEKRFKNFLDAEKKGPGLVFMIFDFTIDCLDSPFTKNNKAALLKEAKRQSRRDRWRLNMFKHTQICGQWLGTGVNFDVDRIGFLDTARGELSGPEQPLAHVNDDRFSGWWWTWLLYAFMTFQGMSSSQLTNSYFSKGLKPPTSCT